MYALAWQRAALVELSDIFAALDPAEQERVAEEVVAFNARLRSNPSDVGESRDGGNRVAFLPLLAVWFRVDGPGRVVRVTTVARYGR